MKRIYDWDAKFSLRNYTAADLRAIKGKRKLTQTTANSIEEAAAAADAGIDLIMGNAQNTKAAREGAPNLFFTAAIALPDFPTEKDVLTAAFQAMKEGADSVYTARGPHIVEMLAREQIPVMCHLGLVPRRSGWNGGLRAIGRTADEAHSLWQAFRRMEDAGAFSVEAEVIPAPVMREISRRTSLVTMSLGSGSGGDVIYLFQNDICGEQPERPRHARAFGDIHSLQEKIRAERRSALGAFRDAVHNGEFPSEAETATIGDADLEEFLERIPVKGDT
ncbi:3-methyl-2-oxobutanoate hydroxymethyltransferase [Roseibium album]|uniref:3-methyl-2-oxobutanoate hydroxymethyltransferase n=1 Tax=Roseibium album TaxID=311410 RepID=A0A0M6ZKX2_9HYPH|nr:3-methyl-2-oxobutanoate hydroxymethyltransferase [Roseibium album]MBG6160239.1 3-methyl-2-oxobutanoate hydroxymethyltransferase [Labrenzia sp. EL_162]MBG6198771.1 3-methyl-2-oxobutanoate hydroxymethyltransferase [Labrenzia sp. EL_159]CTQ63415.1 3-methyl-2-oxobutanoate hydroxymethyltransferase [Roseibium album]CTQ69846.1 3-methyl-2-oxobutanoate hydroxymethyltransferase [Roseibium album]CTQ81002.1 3-methyl-2-oxobutanoate hydroxymethyltransferase [Roseibium album]